MPRLVLIILIVLAVLFFLGIGLGIGREEKVDPDKDSRVQFLRDRLAKPTPLPPDDVSKSCRRDRLFTLPVGGRCEESIAPSSSRIRATRLHVQPGGEVQVDFFPADDDGVEVHVKIRPNKDCRLQIFSGGGRLQLRGNPGTVVSMND